MTAAQWDGLIRLVLAAVIWFALLGGAWWLNRRAALKARDAAQDEAESREGVNGFWR